LSRLAKTALVDYPLLLKMDGEAVMSNFATCSPPYTPRELHAHTCPLIVLSKPRHEVNVHSDERWVRALTYPGFGLRNRVGFLEKTPGRVTVLKERTVVPSRDMISYKTTRPRPPSLKERPSSLGGNWEPERRRLMSPGAQAERGTSSS
jgi:hypothetical protein